MSLAKIPELAIMNIDDAAVSGSIEYMQRALEKWNQATPSHGLHSACCCGWVDLVKWLLEEGANPNIKLNKRSPLYWIIVGDGYAIDDKYRSNTPDKYQELLKIMLEYGLVLDQEEILAASKVKNNNYYYLKPILDNHISSLNFSDSLGR